MRVGIFGGSFDPVHLGHLWIAELCRESLELDQICFMPTATSPLKPQGPVASDVQRLEMLRLATAGHPAMSVDAREINRGGVSYTIDTVRELIMQRPSDQFFLIMGADAFNSLDRWKEPAELLRLVTPVVISRGGDAPADWAIAERMVGADRAAEIKAAMLRLPEIELSSSELRARIKDGRSIRYRVPRPVESYIDAERLYRN